jgi:hypothetical protein
LSQPSSAISWRSGWRFWQERRTTAAFVETDGLSVRETARRMPLT